MSNAVPDGWRLQTIGELVKLQYGKSPKEVMSECGQYPVIGTGGVTGYASSYLFDGCTTVIGRKGTINKPSYVEGKFWAIDTTYFGVDYKGAEPKWFYYSLNSFDLTKYNEASGVPSLGRDTLNAITLSVPPIPEQQKIAAILSSVDDVIEKTRAQIDKLKDLKTGMMQELLTKGIGHSAFKDSPVGRIPEGWNVSELANYLGFISYGFTNPMPESSTGPFMVTAKDINDLKVQVGTARKTTLEAFENFLTDKSRPVVNDILLTKDGTLGRVALVEECNICINQSVAVLRPNKKVLPKFLLYLLASPPYQREMLDKAGGSTIKHIYITVVDKMKVAVPEKAEQERIVNVLDSLFTRVSIAEKKLDRFLSTKKALMQDLLTGKVRVCVDHNEDDYEVEK